MKTTNLHILQQVQSLLDIFDHTLTFPLQKKHAIVFETHPWITNFLSSVKKEIQTLDISQGSFEEQVKIKSPHKKELDFFVKKLRDAYCLVHRCDTRKVPRWMRRQRNEAFILFFDRVFQNISQVESTVLAMLIHVVEKGIEYYKQDFEAYKKAETSKYLSRSDYKKLCLLKRSLEVNIGFLK